jgi:hypothetical protein
LRVGRRSLLGIVGLASATVMVASVTLPALAHPGGTMGISLSAERLPPGGALEIIGTDFTPDTTLRVRLAGPTGEWALPDVTSGPDGHFAVVLAVPPDAPAGPYTVDAISASGIFQRETFEVDPTAPAPDLTPTPNQASGLLGRVELGDSTWEVIALVVLALVAVGFLVLVRRRRPTGP